ncbi:FAD-dependent oxidoreductase [Acinetobacter sp. HC8-3S]
MLDITDMNMETAAQENSEEYVVQPVVIIGSGHAGYQLASALRAQSSDLSITVFTADDGALYSKPALSNALALGKDSESLVRESALSWEQRLNIRVYPHTQVLAIDRDHKKFKPL